MPVSFLLSGIWICYGVHVCAMLAWYDNPTLCLKLNYLMESMFHYLSYRDWWSGVDVELCQWGRAAQRKHSSQVAEGELLQSWGSEEEEGGSHTHSCCEQLYSHWVADRKSYLMHTPFVMWSAMSQPKPIGPCITRTGECTCVTM